MTVEIVRLDSSYKGKKLLFQYETDYYYDLEEEHNTDGVSFGLRLKPFNKTMEKQFSISLLGDWLEEPQLFGAVERGQIKGYLELSKETWNNRIRISNILVEKEHRHQGIGRLLMDTAWSQAKQEQARALILETQSCNFPAISFYQACGFKITGFDLLHYSNQDVERKEFRIEMGTIVE